MSCAGPPAPGVALRLHCTSRASTYMVSVSMVRPQDWPVVPVATVGFKLRADGFFDTNPALDLPLAEHQTG